MSRTFHPFYRLPGNMTSRANQQVTVTLGPHSPGCSVVDAFPTHVHRLSSPFVKPKTNRGWTSPISIFNEPKWPTLVHFREWIEKGKPDPKKKKEKKKKKRERTRSLLGDPPADKIKPQPTAPKNEHMHQTQFGDGRQSWGGNDQPSMMLCRWTAHLGQYSSRTQPARYSMCRSCTRVHRTY